MSRIWVKTKVDRIAWTQPTGGIQIPTDRYMQVEATPWIRALIDKHEDITPWTGPGLPPPLGQPPVAVVTDAVIQDVGPHDEAVAAGDAGDDAIASMAGATQDAPVATAGGV